MTTDFLKPWYDTEGPLGFPMPDRAAKVLDETLKKLPHDAAHDYRRITLGAGVSELQAGERADVSWISEEAPDRYGEIVVAAGMDDSQFALNPIVTLQHAYAMPPVGRSVWRRRVREGALRGVKAKTHYPPRPDGWTADDWPADYAWQLIQADLMRGKSIGFLPLQVHAPTEAEVRKRPELKDVHQIIDRWLLLEYACCFLPVQPNCLIEQVAKALDRPLPESIQKALGLAAPPLPFTPLAEVEKAVQRRVQGLDMNRLIDQAVERVCSQALGRI
jgi:hypothetical protein